MTPFILAVPTPALECPGHIAVDGWRRSCQAVLRDWSCARPASGGDKRLGSDTYKRASCKAGAGIRFNEHLEADDGEAVFRHACKMGLEGIVSKRKDSPYKSGRSPHWLRMKNPACEAVRRDEEDWGR
jgi:hypothetical protein